MELNRCHTSTILPPVVLFLHEQVKFVNAIERGVILIAVILEGLPQSDQHNAALMFDGFTHSSEQSYDSFLY
jgi:hypothetical protein